ncbi:MAG: DUF2076 domain-containing protein [Mesorhizobium sp.]|nr:MAG: DUF2076 domain-containing protein [Mesorhizobium sp.]
MDRNDQQAIGNLFEKLANVERQTPEPLSGNDRQRAGGGFLAGAAQTAMGVAGGVLLSNAITGMFGGSEAQATEPAASQPDEAAADPAGDAGSDGGGDFGDIEF